MNPIVRIIRKVALACLKRLNPGDITIRHHYTMDPLTIHSFRHRGYWYHGKTREGETMRLFSQLIKTGDTVVEVGGHVGYISLYFAHLAGPNGRVICFEPGPNNLPYIRKNTAAISQITVVEQAVTNYDGTARFYTEDLTGQNNSLLSDYEVFKSNVASAGVRVRTDCIEVSCVTLDSYLDGAGFSQPSLVKIDVEGAELSVLEGFRTTLAASDIALMVEVTHQEHAVHELLRDLGFCMYTPGRSVVTNPSQMRGNVFCLKATDPRMALFQQGNATLVATPN